MSEPLKEQCPICSGAGTIPHAKRVMANGEPDPADFRIRDLCDRCGASGVVPVNKAAIVEHRPGNIADTFAGE